MCFGQDKEVPQVLVVRETFCFRVLGTYCGCYRNDKQETRSERARLGQAPAILNLSKKDKPSYQGPEEPEPAPNKSSASFIQKDRHFSRSSF